jgi:flagellin
MPSYINTNISSLNAQRNLNTSQSALATSLQRLSSGLRINSARDDAAGMAISSRMTSQINGNNQASRNANDGISLAQTAEGDLAQIGTNLQRMRDLAVQSANATNSASDRAALQSEVASLAAEIDRVSQNSSFNGVKLLDGSFVSQNFQVGAGASAADQIAINAISSARTTELGAAGTTNYAANVTGTNTTAALAAGDLTLNGIQVGASVNQTGAGQTASSAFAIATAINAVQASTGVTATAGVTSAVGLTATAFTSIAANSFSVNGVNVGAVAAGTNQAGQAANVAAAINAISAQTGVTASVTGSSSLITGQVSLSAVDGRNINLTATTLNVAGVITPYASTNMVAQTGFAATLSDTVTAAAAVTAASTSVTVNGVAVTGASSATVLGTAQNFVAAFNNKAGLSANATTLAGITASTNVDGVITLTSSGTATSPAAGMNVSAASGGFVGTQFGLYNSQHGAVGLSSTSSSGILLSGAKVANGGFTSAATAATTTSSNMASVATVNVSTAAGALAALSAIDGAITQVNTSRASLGAYQNRFGSVVTSLQTTSENLTASRSRIMDTDFAQETSQLTRNQILQQAGTAMLAQANQLPQNVLTLLR